jgi:hypothetical protein
MRTELVPDSSENLHILTRLCTRENFTEFCYRERFMACLQLLQSYNLSLYAKVSIIFIHPKDCVKLK